MEAVKDKSGIELNIFERVQLVVGEGRLAGIYKSRIEDVINGGVVISNPEFISGRSLLRNGVDVTVMIVRRDAAYQFNSRVHSHKAGGLKQVILTPPRRLERVQRRMFARVELASEIVFGELRDRLDWDNWTQAVAWHKTRSANISGGGVLMNLPEEMNPGQLIALSANVMRDQALPLYVPAVCRRTYETAGRIFGGFEFILAEDLGLHFRQATLEQMPEVLKSFSTKAQDRLVALLFNKQIEQRRRGAL